MMLTAINVKAIIIIRNSILFIIVHIFKGQNYNKIPDWSKICCRDKIKEVKHNI